MICWQEWQLFKVFDSRVETEESDDETEFALSQEVTLSGSAAQAALPPTLHHEQNIYVVLLC